MEVPRHIGYISLREALRDFLKEQGLTVNDVLDAMDETPELLEKSILKRVNISWKELRGLESSYTTRQLNLIVFVIQVFYLANVSGMYKNRVIIPPREEVVGSDGRVTKEGLIKIIRSLGLRPRFVDIHI